MRVEVEERERMGMGMIVDGRSVDCGLR